jgi:hypothetical protein
MLRFQLFGQLQLYLLALRAVFSATVFLRSRAHHWRANRYEEAHHTQSAEFQALKSRAQEQETRLTALQRDKEEMAQRCREVEEENQAHTALVSPPPPPPPLTLSHRPTQHS